MLELHGEQPRVNQKLVEAKECTAATELKIVRRETIKDKIPGWDDEAAMMDKSRCLNKIGRMQTSSNVTAKDLRQQENQLIRRSVEAEPNRVTFRPSVIHEARPTLGRSILKGRPSVRPSGCGSVYVTSRGNSVAAKPSIVRNSVIV